MRGQPPWDRITTDLARVVAAHPRWLMVRANRMALICWNADHLRLIMGPARGKRVMNAMEDALDDLVARDARRRLG